MKIFEALTHYDTDVFFIEDRTKKNFDILII